VNNSIRYVRTLLMTSPVQAQVVGAELRKWGTIRLGANDSTRYCQYLVVRLATEPVAMPHEASCHAKKQIVSNVCTNISHRQDGTIGGPTGRSSLS
jgi:hypothetical protein